MKGKWRRLIPLLLLSLLLTACDISVFAEPAEPYGMESEAGWLTLENVPAYSGAPYVVLNGNVPQFSEQKSTA